MQRQIVMIGTRRDTKGGIASVVNVYLNAGLFDRWNAIYIPTHCEGSWASKLLIAIYACLRVFILLASGQVLALHVHSATRGSFWRKRVFMLLAFTFRVPVILHMHGGEFLKFFYDECTPRKQRKIRSVLQRCTYIIAVSEKGKADLLQLAPTSNVIAIANPVEIPAWTETSPSAHGTLLYLAHLRHKKGIYDLLNAMRPLIGDFPDLCLVAGGDGEVGEVRRKSRELGLAEHVELVGWVQGDNKAELLRKSWLFVLPSHFEGLPMAVLEAMAAGLPVVSTAVGGIPQVVRDGVDGFIIPPGDVDALERAIRKLLIDSNLRQRMGASARQRIRSKFSAQIVVPQIETIWESLGLSQVTKP